MLPRLLLAEDTTWTVAAARKASTTITTPNTSGGGPNGPKDGSYHHPDAVGPAVEGQNEAPSLLCRRFMSGNG